MLSPLAPETPPAPDAGADPVRDVNLANFIAEVIEASRAHPVIVNFLSPRSPACKQLLPVLEKVVRTYKGAVTLARIDIDASPQIAQQMGVQSVPAVFAFFQGRPLDGFMGPLPEAQIKSWLDRLMKTIGGGAPGTDGLDEALKHAADALVANDPQTAQAIYAEILGADPAHPAATAGLLRAYILRGDMDGAKAIFAQLPPELVKDKVFDSLRAVFELAEEAGAGGDAAALQAKLAQNPNDHQARFDLAMAHYAAGRREQAVDELLEIVRRARSWNEDAARKQLVKFFEAFGSTDPLTVTARKRLSSILFA